MTAAEGWVDLARHLRSGYLWQTRDHTSILRLLQAAFPALEPQRADLLRRHYGLDGSPRETYAALITATGLPRGTIGRRLEAGRHALASAVSAGLLLQTANSGSAPRGAPMTAINPLCPACPEPHASPGDRIAIAVYELLPRLTLCPACTEALRDLVAVAKARVEAEAG